MKKHLIAAAAIAAFAGLSLAQQPAAPAGGPAPKPAAPPAFIPTETLELVKPVDPKKKKPAAKTISVTGTITSMNTLMNTLTLEDDNNMNMTFNVDVKVIETFKVDDRVTVKLKGGKVISVLPVKDFLGNKVVVHRSSGVPAAAMPMPPIPGKK